MVPTANGSSNGFAIQTGPDLPAWFTMVTINKAVQERVGSNVKISSVSCEKDVNANENHSTLLVRIKVDVQMKDGNTKNLSFLLKTQHENEAMANILNILKLLVKEELMYHTIIPKFEQLYKEVGKTVRFAPKAYKFDRDIGVDYVLLEDLKECKFKHANNTTGLDMDHMKSALLKLAEFHAASACYVEHFGMYGEEFTVGIFSEANKKLLKEFNASSAFLAQLKKWKFGQQYYQKLADSDPYLVDRLLQDQKVKPNEFKVLNHGDIWSSNIMFKYDAFEKIRSTVFVDFQVGKYGSPANDLYYLILSSAAMDIKLAQFDYFVRYYYDNLLENLKILKYQRPLPKLKNLHATLLQNGLAAYLVVSKVLPVVMQEKSLNTQLDNLTLDDAKLKAAMYANHKYAQAMAEILPWMDNRGLLDWK